MILLGFGIGGNNLNFEIFSSVSKALNKAKSMSEEDDLIYIGGSTFVVAEIL